MNIVDRLLSGRMERLYRDAIDEQVRAIADELVPQIFSEQKTGNTLKLEKSLHLVSTKRKAAIKYLTEKQSVTRRPVNPFNRSSRILSSPYRYDRIDSFYLKESYFSRSIARQVETMLRNGYEFVSDENDLAAIVRKELSRMQLGSVPGLGRSLDQTIATMAGALKKYGMFVVEKRRVRSDNLYRKEPPRYRRIERLRILRPSDVTIYIDNASNISSVQEHYSRYGPVRTNAQGKATSEIPLEDIAIGLFEDVGDSLFPVPPCYQTFDDILTLRSIEETIELLVFQFGSPILHAKVGTDADPGTAAEVAQVHNSIVAMAPNGMITTNNRVTIDVLSIQKAVADLMPYVDHFKNRVLSGSGSSGITVGEGSSANRNTAASIDDALSDHCTFLGRSICDVFEYNIIPDILTSVGVPTDALFNADGDPTVRMSFNEMRLEKQIMRENHVINKWNSHLITLPEARKALKHTPLSSNDELRAFAIDIPLKKAGSKTEEPDGIGASRSQNSPANQHGVKAGPGSVKN